MSSDHDKNSKELESKIDEKRKKVISQADRIDSQLSPGAILDKYYFRDQAGSATGYLSRVKEDPVPGALIGAAVTYIIAREEAPQYQRTKVKGKLKGMIKDAKSEASSALESLSDTKDQASNKVQESWEKLKENTNESALKMAHSAQDIVKNDAFIPLSSGLSLGCLLGAYANSKSDEIRS